MTSPFIDFHTHHIQNDSEVIAVVSLHEKYGNFSFYHTIGLHPWFEISSSENAYNMIKDQFKNTPSCLGIGECGLDKLRGNPIEMQRSVFENLIEIANELNAPLIIHCVRAHEIILHLYKKFAQTNWAIHGFCQNKILAKQMVDAGIFLSVSPGSKNSTAFLDMLKFLPYDFLFIESDVDNSISINQRYSLFSEIRGIDLEDLKNLVYDNFKLFFQQKWKLQIG